MSSLVGLGRRTISGMLCASSQHLVDWSAAYRLFEDQRFDPQALFTPARQEVVSRLEGDEPLVVMMDDTLIRKRGRHVYGSGWKRDPLGPPFRTNFVWGQRFLQISAALPDELVSGQARGIPIDLTHAPSPKKPRKRASAAEWDEYRGQQQAMKVSALGRERLIALRNQLDKEKINRKIIVSADGGFTNRTVFRDLPENIVAVGRIRKDAKLFLPPVEEAPRRGRRRWYGQPMPTPEQIRRDDEHPWQSVQAFAAGTTHSFEIKTVGPVRWTGTGSRDVRVVIIRPLAYRPRKGAHLLYRNPVYLLCTDPDLPLNRLLQAYLWRWEVELNFRDEKTVIGVGEAQVRSKAAVETVPAFVVAAYAFLLLAGTDKMQKTANLPQPKWRTSAPPKRISAARMIGLFRAQLWAKAMGVNLQDFVEIRVPAPNQVLFEKSLPAAVCYAFR